MINFLIEIGAKQSLDVYFSIFGIVAIIYLIAKIKDKFEKSKGLESEIRSLDSDLENYASKM